MASLSVIEVSTHFIRSTADFEYLRRRPARRSKPVHRADQRRQVLVQGINELKTCGYQGVLIVFVDGLKELADAIGTAHPNPAGLFFVLVACRAPTEMGLPLPHSAAILSIPSRPSFPASSSRAVRQSMSA